MLICKEENGVEFNTLHPGTCFIYENKYFMKTVKLDFKETGIYNSVDLISGDMKYINNYWNVFPVKAKVVVE